MIRVLIVDDEKIVRKGLVSFMPWQDFGMVVVGEANNGENALQFMETHMVDLLLTDLAMPVMSGIELMREVRRRFPHVQIAVLTLHQDFEYVQEALRLGAIDYLVKTQLEEERIEDVLGRMAALMERKIPAPAPASAASPSARQTGPVEELYALYALHPHSDEAKPDIPLPEGAAEADAGVWYWTRRLPEPFRPRPDYALVEFRDIRDIPDLDRGSLLRLLRLYRKHHLFYDYDPSKPLHFAASRSILHRGTEEAVPEMNAAKQDWLALQWVFDDAVFHRMVLELRSMNLPPIRLARMFYTLTDEWNRLYRQLLAAPIVVEDFFASWFHFEAWLRGSREALLQANAKPQYSAEIRNSIAKAMNIVKQRLDQPPGAGEIAQMVNMSGSYFSQCFKQIAGQTYTDYLRDIRMERAKEYLTKTNKTIQWIAEQIGYHDEKYFSRLFRDQVGMLPSDYRQKNL